MKLIDILVQELPKRGGWPAEAIFAMQDSDGLVKFSRSGEKIYHDYSDGHEWCSEGGYDWIRDGVPFEGNFRTQVSQDNVTAFISREKYEAALSASKPEWDGEGLPPVGFRVEANFGGEWVEATVAYTDRPEGHSDAVAWKEALVFDCKTTRPFWADEFRPIRSVADKIRGSIISKIEKAYKDCPHSDAVPQAIYEAIAEHIRID